MIQLFSYGIELPILGCHHTQCPNVTRQAGQDLIRPQAYRKTPKDWLDLASAKDLSSDKTKLNAFYIRQCFSAPRIHLELHRYDLATYVFPRNSNQD